MREAQGPAGAGLWGAAAFIALAAAAAALPFLPVPSYVRTLSYYAAYFLALGQAWNMMSGLTGYVSFAHGALAGIGAYTVVIAMNRDVPLGAALVLASLVTAAISLFIGATSLRLRGTAFTFATLFFQQFILLLVRKLPVAGGAGGLVLEEILPVWLPHVLMLTAATVTTLAVFAFRRTSAGLRVQAMRDDEDAASAIGIGATRLKLILFASSAAAAGFAGAVHGIFAASLYPNAVFSVDISIVALAVPLIGGGGTAFGPVAGAILYVFLREALQTWAPNLHLAIVGAILLTAILFMREGIMPALLRRFSPAKLARGVSA